MNNRKKAEAGISRPGTFRRGGFCRPVSLQGSLTVEMSFLMPIILLLFMGCVFAAFYFHDKNILAGAAYETAVVGSTKARERDGVTEEELKRLCRQRIKGKCLFLTVSQVSVDVSEEEIQVRVTARRKIFSVSVLKCAAVTAPEKKIRDADRVRKGAEFVTGKLEGLLDGFLDGAGGDGGSGGGDSTGGEIGASGEH